MVKRTSLVTLLLFVALSSTVLAKPLYENTVEHFTNVIVQFAKHFNIPAKASGCLDSSKGMICKVNFGRNGVISAKSDSANLTDKVIVTYDAEKSDVSDEIVWEQVLTVLTGTLIAGGVQEQEYGQFTEGFYNDIQKIRKENPNVQRIEKSYLVRSVETNGYVRVEVLLVPRSFSFRVSRRA